MTVQWHCYDHRARFAALIIFRLADVNGALAVVIGRLPPLFTSLIVGANTITGSNQRTVFIGNKNFEIVGKSIVEFTQLRGYRAVDAILNQRIAISRSAPLLIELCDRGMDGFLVADVA